MIIAEVQAGFRAGTNIQSQDPLREIPAASAESLPCLHRLHEGVDRVRHQASWATMRKYSINANIMRVIENLYDKAQSAVLFNGSTGDWFRTTEGVRQECLLLPTLFNIFLERIIYEALDDHECSVSIGGRLFTNPRFADGIQFVVNALCAFERRIQALEKRCYMRLLIKIRKKR